MLVEKLLLSVCFMFRQLGGHYSTSEHKTNGEFYYSVDLSKDVKYKAEAAV